MTRYAFDEVRAALKKHWGMSLHRGGEMSDDYKHDGRWTVEYSRTGYVVGGQFPRGGYGYRRFRSLSDVVRACDLGDVVAEGRR